MKDNEIFLMHINTGNVDTLENWRADFKASSSSCDWYGCENMDTEKEGSGECDHPLCFDTEESDLLEVMLVNGEWEPC